MSIRPVDMQVMVQKTPDVAKPLLNEAKHPEVQQHTLAEKTVKESLHNEERVAQTERGENGTVNKDGKGGAEYQRNKNKRENKKGDQHEDEPAQQSGFDFSV